MYLYDRKDDKIYVFKLTPNNEKIIDYRISEIKKEDIIFYQAKADASTPNKILENNIFEINIDDLNIKKSQFIPCGGLNFYNNKYHSLTKDSINKEILYNYCSGLYVNKRIIKVYKEIINPDDDIIDIIGKFDMRFNGIGMEGNINNKNIVTSYKKIKQYIKYLLITDEYEKQDFSIHMIMKNILSIPKSLYILQMLEKGNIDMILDEEIDEQLKLFDLELYPERIIPYVYLKGAINCGLIDEKIENLDTKIDNSRKILNKIRK